MRPSITVSNDLARRSDVIDAALAVNAAPTLAEAFRVLAEAGCRLVEADCVTVVVWEDDSVDGAVRAAAGAPGGQASAVGIPLSTSGWSASLEASWRTARTDAEADEARAALRTLTRLTSIAERSAREREQRLLLDAGKLAALGELAAGVAHEINNPLFAILGLTEFLLKEAEPGSKARERLDLIQESGREIRDIVRALLDFARESAEERRVVGLEETVESTIDLVRRTNANKGVELVASYEAGGALVQASPNQLKQILLHLIADARRAIPEGGVIDVAARREGDGVNVSVSRDGAAALAASTGLAVSSGLAAENGGSVTVSSTGRRTMSTLRLPVLDGDARR
ncbi:MAG: sensor histidine kinase [Gaiellaceae bacterium]